MSNTEYSPESEYITIKEAAKRFGISSSTQYRLIGRGFIEAVKVGRHTRIVAASVEKYFANLPRLGKQEA